MKFFKNLKKELLLLGIVSIAVGTVMAIFPETVGQYMGYVIGGILILSGGASLIGILVKKGVKPFSLRVIPAALAVAVGFLFLFGADFVYEILWVFVGVAIIMNSNFKNAYAYELKYSGNKKWWWNLVVSLISLALGIVLILKPIESQNGMIILTGIFLVADGFCDLFSFSIFVNEYARIRKEERRVKKEEARKLKLTEKERKMAIKIAKKKYKGDKKNGVIDLEDVVDEAKLEVAKLDENEKASEDETGNDLEDVK